MKKQISNIALEGTRSGDVVGGLLLWTGESLQALLFWKEATMKNKESNDCLKCVKWDNGKGLEVLYQAGIRPAMLQAESVLKTTRDHIEMRQIGSIVDYLQEMDEAIVGFQAELGLIEDSKETAV